MIGKISQEKNLIDTHCHIVPYSDDGADDFEIATRMLRQEYEQGVRTIVMTVHYKFEMFDTPIDKVLRHFEELKGWLDESYMSDMEIMLCREYYCDDRLLALLDGYEKGLEEVVFEDITYSPRNEIVPFGENKCILLEFSSNRMQDQEFELFVKKASHAGLTPIIAHVERYPAVQERPTIVCKMRDLGAYIQVNCASLLSKRSTKENEIAVALLKNGVVDMLASDAHDLEKRSPNIKKCYSFLEKRFGKNTADELLRDNARSLIYSFG